MGKGSGSCTAPAIGLALTADPSDQPGVSEEQLAEADFSPYGGDKDESLSFAESSHGEAEAIVASMHLDLFEETSKAEGVEAFEKKCAQDTLAHAGKLFAEGADQAKVDAYFSRREKKRAAERLKMFKNYNWPEDQPEIDYEAEMPMIAKLAARRTYVQLGDPTDGTPTPAHLRFQEQFMNSDDFQRHLKNLLAEDTTSQLAAGAVAGKEMEDVYRAATLRTIGISEADPTQTIGRWTDADGTEYHIEVMREFSGSAMIDLVMLAREAGSKDGEVYSMQWKSYQTNDTITNNPVPGRSRNSRAIKIDRLTDIPRGILKKGSDEEVLMEAIKTAQLRLLATNTFVDTSSFKQNARIEKGGKAYSGGADWITYVTRLSRPEVHKAITQADPQALLASAQISSKGKIFIPVELEVEGDKHQVQIQTGLEGKKIKSGPRKGTIELSSRQDSKIGINIPVKGWRQAHAIAAPSVVRASGLLQYGELQGASTIEELDRVVPHFQTDFRGE